MARSPCKGWPYFPRGSTPQDFARRWWDWKERLGHRVDLTPAGLARATGVSRWTAARAIATGPLPYAPRSLVVHPLVVQLELPPLCKALWTHIHLEGSGGWYGGTWWALASRLGCGRRTVPRILAALKAAGMLQERETGRQGFVVHLERRCSNVAPVKEQRGTGEVVQHGTGSCSNVAPEETTPQTTPLQARNGVLLDLSNPPSWARNHPGGEVGALWAMLSSSLVRDQLPAEGPLPPRLVRQVLELARVRVRVRPLAEALAGAGLDRSRLLELVKATSDGVRIRDRSAFFRASLESYLSE